ncbi:MAG: alpha/beta fold hydrolase [Halofilum sp. (in: g-proteobacteria)]|nr:alpha/beta fold hydrolase [Halofilum sp. (in: g-proteobacteria)]
MSTALPECVEIPAPGTHRWSVIWLHGLGADGHDFEPIVAELRLPADHGVRFVFPHAPRRAVTVNAGMEMRAWYDIAAPDIAAHEDEAGIRDSAAIVDTLIAAEVERGVPAERVVLAGFSQGGALALHAGLRHGERLAGIVALSAYLPLADRLADELADANGDTPIFQAHGTQDPIVPLALARASHERIAALRPPPEWHTYPLDHGVCAQEITDLRRWLVDTVGMVQE